MVSNQSNENRTVLIVLVVVLSILLLLAIGCLFVLQGISPDQADAVQTQPTESVPVTTLSTEAPTETQPETQTEIPETIHEHVYTLLSETAPSCALEGAAAALLLPG